MTQLIIISPEENEGIYQLYTEEGEQVASAMAFDPESAVISFNTIAVNRMFKQKYGDFDIVFVKDSGVSEHELLIAAREYHNRATKRLCPECLN